MAIFHISVSIVSRKAGRSSTGAAAYRAAERLVDARTGDDHDYRRKRGVEGSQIVLPAGCEWRPNRSELWNAVEHKNKRADAQVAREFEVALPAEISASSRKELAVEFAQRIADRYGVAADVAIHRPSRAGDERNHHAHILTTTNRVERDGRLGNKVRELDAVARDRSAAGRDRPNEVEHLRGAWAELTNRYLAREGFTQRVDHRSLSEQRDAARARGEHDRADDLDREPTRHLGPAATAMERGAQRERAEAPIREWRRAPRSTEIGDANRRIELAAQIGKIRREQNVVGRSLIDTQTSLEQALEERDARLREEREMPEGRGEPRSDNRQGLRELQARLQRRPISTDDARERGLESDRTLSAAGDDQTQRGTANRQSLAERFAQLLKPGRQLAERGDEFFNRDDSQSSGPTQSQSPEATPTDLRGQTAPFASRDEAAPDIASRDAGSVRLQEIAKRIRESRQALDDRADEREHPGAPDIEH